MTSSPLLAQVAPFVADRDWEQVRAALTVADGRSAIPAAALELLAEALWWLGRVNECVVVRHRALDWYERLGDPGSAARVALLLSEDHRRQGHRSIAEGWRRRAARLLDGQPERAEHGYLRLYEGEAARREGRLETARSLLAEAAAIADHVGDRDLAADVTQETGRILIASGARAEGLAVMDEAMITASEGRLSPYTTGKIFCCLMSACDDLGDVERVADWERSSSAWSRRDGANVFPGMCRVHHADVLAHQGRWSDAEREAERACEELREVGWVVAYAYATLGHLRRRRGDRRGAGLAFAEAERLGVSPEAGWSLLLLDEGNIIGALGRIVRAVAATPAPLARARLLPTLVEIAVAADDRVAARNAADELERIATTFETSKLRAIASTARARVCLAAGDWVGACSTATAALQQWHQLGAPYETATARVLHARACRALDDHEGWRTSSEIAADLLASLGADADLVTAEHPRADRTPTAAPSGLTARELVVLRLLATGATNRTIATELVVSEKTVSRHLGNIFTKLGVSTRAAATAYAFTHDLARER